MSKMKLEDLLPAKPEAEINGKKYSFRAPTLADDVWIKDNIGGAIELKAMVNETKWEKIAKLAYHLIDPEGRKDFRARKAIIVSESTGEDVERFLTGPEVFLEHITGVQQGIQIMGAITRAMANANPMIADLVKKNLEQAAKVMETVGERVDPIGAKFSTRSKVNTSGRKRK